ncbi:uncharacterized protein LOC134266340 isoform X1 [Saccostrea cucullata]|uniref:uncharacterized protein LOC134266340 isoform X1 n=1 Tax=Saccostrea cuccullata TaxID=36930 RepID=UPI002ED1415A
MLRFRYNSVLFLIGLLTTGHTESKTLRRFARDLTLDTDTVPEEEITFENIARVLVEFFAKMGKRSTENAIPRIHICKFNNFDLNGDNTVTKEDFAILIQSTGLVQLEELFDKLDQNDDEILTQEEYNVFHDYACTGNGKAETSKIVNQM